MWKPTSITGLQRSIFSWYFSSACAKVSPGVCMQKSISVVVPPNAAATVPEVKSSHVVVPPKNISMCVCGSIAPGITYLPVGVDHLVGGDVERLAEQRHRAVVDEDVADVVVRRGHDPAALDQNRHQLNLSSGSCVLYTTSRDGPQMASVGAEISTCSRRGATPPARRRSHRSMPRTSAPIAFASSALRRLEDADASSRERAVGVR